MGRLVLLSIPVNGILLIVWAVIVYFNKPGFLVSPHMRDDPGLRVARRRSEL